MKISPPIAVLAIVTIGVAITSWLAPAQREAAETTVTIPASTYQKLELWGKEQFATDGRPLAVAQVIEALANTWEGAKESR